MTYNLIPAAVIFFALAGIVYIIARRLPRAEIANGVKNKELKVAKTKVDLSVPKKATPSSVPKVTLATNPVSQAVTVKEPKTTSPSFQEGVDSDPINTAKKLIEKGDYQKAQKILEGILEQKENLEAKKMLAQMFIKNLRWQSALPLLESLVKKKEDDKEAWGNLGLAHFQLKNFSSAIAYYQRALNFDENNVEYLRNLAKIALKMDNKPLAKMTLGKLEALEPEDEEIKKELKKLEKK